MIIIAFAVLGVDLFYFETTRATQLGSNQIFHLKFAEFPVIISANDERHLTFLVGSSSRIPIMF